MTQEEFAQRIGGSQGHFSYIERGEKEIGADILLRITEEFQKSIEWLLTGKGYGASTACETPFFRLKERLSQLRPPKSSKSADVVPMAAQQS